MRRNQTKTIYQDVFKEACPFFEEESQYKTCEVNTRNNVERVGVGKTITIMIAGPNGSDFRIKCSEEITVGRLKRKLAELPQFGIPAFWQRIMFDCQALENQKTLKDYNVEDMSILEIYIEQQGC